MTVSSTSNKIIYSGNNATTVWSFSFPGVAASDLQVYYTDANGNITLLASNLYSVSLNAAVGANPTGIGGTVTYPLTGSPIAVGTFLTILRTLPLTQATSLANQGTIYQSVVEAELDILLMQIQQLNELLGRQITVAVSDSTPTALPAATQRAGLYMAFDSSGNPTAVAGTSSTNPVSSAMTPVVAAATLALGRSALGLGNVAVENIGAGLQDDGSGNLRARFTPVADSTSQAVVAGFHWTERHATGALTYTCPLTSTLFDGFGFFVYSLTSSVTFAINAADAFSGMPIGTSLIIPPGTWAYISTDGAGTWFVRGHRLFGATNPLNYSIVASVAANILTVAIKDSNGNDPSTASPVFLPVRNPTVANGAPTYRIITSALSIVAPNGASFGAPNSTAFRLWLEAFDNAGTISLALINAVANASTNPTIYPVGRTLVESPTQISAGATSAKTFYSQAAGIASKSYSVLGFLTWETGLATAGAWSAGPTVIQLANGLLPGQEVQVQQNFTGAVATGTTQTALTDTIPPNTSGDQYMSQAITPISAANILEIRAQSHTSNTANADVTVALYQDAIANALAASIARQATTGVIAVGSLFWSMLAGLSVSTTFKVRAGANAGGTTTFNGLTSAREWGGVANSYLTVKEIMG